MQDNAHGDNATTVTEANDNSTNEQSTDTKPSFMTVDQVNRAITSHNKRLEKQFQSEFESLKALLTKQNENTETTDKVESAQSKSDKPDPELLRMKKNLEELAKQLDLTKQEKEREVQQRRDAQVKSEVLKVLTELKVEKSDQVYKLVKDNLILDEDANNIKLRFFNPQLGIEEELDLKGGLTDWLNIEGSHFLPAKNTTGSGATSSGTKGQKRVYSMAELDKLSPSELAKVDLQKILAEQNLI